MGKYANYYLASIANSGIPGAWQPKQNGAVKSAWLVCPGCGKLASLDDHEIDTLGYVHPSVECPNLKCDFHEYVLLGRWDYPE